MTTNKNFRSKSDSFYRFAANSPDNSNPNSFSWIEGSIKGICYGFIFVLFMIFSSKTIIAQELEKPLRLMSYNIRTARGMDNIQDYDRIAAIINSKKPDVVAIQELDMKNERSQNDDILAELANRTDMNASFSGAISFRGGEYGIGILSKEKPLQLRRLPLPGSEEKRTFLIAEFENYIFCCTHFSLTEADRQTSVQLIQNELKNETKITFLAGDFNAKPESPTILSLTQNCVNLTGENPTYSADKPNICIDFIFGMDPTGNQSTDNPNWQTGILQSEVLNEPLASDHLPIFVEFNLSALK